MAPSGAFLVARQGSFHGINWPQQTVVWSAAGPDTCVGTRAALAHVFADAVWLNAKQLRNFSGGVKAVRVNDCLRHGADSIGVNGLPKIIGGRLFIFTEQIEAISLRTTISKKCFR